VDAATIAKLKECRSFARCERSQNGGLQAMLDIDRDTASRLGIVRSSSTTRSTTPSAAPGFDHLHQLNQYMSCSSPAAYQENPDALKSIYVKSASGAQVPLSSFTRFVPGTTPSPSITRDSFRQ